jgi:hypothetical protein
MTSFFNVFYALPLLAIIMKRGLKVEKLFPLSFLCISTPGYPEAQTGAYCPLCPLACKPGTSPPVSTAALHAFSGAQPGLSRQHIAQFIIIREPCGSHYLLFVHITFRLHLMVRFCFLSIV